MQWGDLPSLKLLSWNLKLHIVLSLARLLVGLLFASHCFGRNLLSVCDFQVPARSPQARCWQLLSAFQVSASTGSLTLLYPALGMLVVLHLAVPALGCPGETLLLPLQCVFLQSEWKPLDSFLLTRRSWSSLSQSPFLGSYLFTLSSCLSHSSSLLVSPGLQKIFTVVKYPQFHIRAYLFTKMLLLVQHFEMV